MKTSQIVRFTLYAVIVCLSVFVVRPAIAVTERS